MVWYCRYGVPECPECKRDGAEGVVASATTDRLYFQIPFAEKDKAKELGAKWDPTYKCWYGLLSNPKLSLLGRRWPPHRGVNAQYAKQSVRTPATQASLDLTKPVEEEYVPPPGAVPWDELMDALNVPADKSTVPASKPASRSVTQENYENAWRTKQSLR